MYETDLTDFQWQVIAEILPDTRRSEHSRALAALGCQRVALLNRERLPVAAPAARVSAFPASLLLFPALATTAPLAAGEPGPDPGHRWQRTARRRPRSCAWTARASNSRRAFLRTGAPTVANTSTGANGRLSPMWTGAFSLAASTRPTATTVRRP